MSWLFLSMTILMTSAANLFIKATSLRAKAPVTGVKSLVLSLLTPTFIAGVFFLAAALLPYTLALRKLDLSVAYPVMTTSVLLLVSVFSIILFREQFTLVKAVGMVVLMCGVLLISIK